eukprot:PITA_14604
MLGLDPAIVKHHINTWPNAILVRQKLRPIHPSCHEAIKVEIDKLKQADFIYPIEYTTWVSNPVPILKNIGRGDQLKTTFISLWGTFAYRVMSFGLKNVGATFQWSMSYCFYNLVHLVLTHLDDLTTRSRSQVQHIHDLRAIFLRCRKYKFCLNPLKCVSCVPIGHLLGFIVLKYDITLDPMKVQAILEFPPPLTLH